MTPKTIEGEGGKFDKLSEWNKRAIQAGKFRHLVRVIGFGEAMDMIDAAYEQGKKDALRASESAPDISPD